MMDKLPKTGSELEKMVLAELREVPQCTGALHVTVVPYNDYRVPATCPTGREDDGYRWADRDIPIISLSAHALAGEREKAIAAGCDEFDTTPIEFDRLVATLRRVLAHRTWGFHLGVCASEIAFAPTRGTFGFYGELVPIAEVERHAKAQMRGFDKINRVPPSVS
jgi:CheY-like chemotaxis protein